MTDIAKYGHYALNVPVYTHFTSPIRRYADVLVHRQLDAVLQGSDSFPIDREGMAKIAQQCNVKRDAAKLAQEQSQHLYLCLLLHDLTVRYGPVVREATVVGVLDAAFDVVVPEFGIEKRVHLDQIPTEHHTFDERTNELSIYWRKGVDTISWLAETNDDPHLRALKERVDRHEAAIANSKIDSSSQAQQDEAALFEDDDDEAVTKPPASASMQHTTSMQREKSRTFREDDVNFVGVEAPPSGHSIQTVKVLQTIPVVISARVGDKSPPVITVLAINPAAKKK
jgi:protein SSD1